MRYPLLEELVRFLAILCLLISTRKAGKSIRVSDPANAEIDIFEITNTFSTCKLYEHFTTFCIVSPLFGIAYLFFTLA